MVGENNTKMLMIWIARIEVSKIGERNKDFKGFVDGEGVGDSHSDEEDAEGDDHGYGPMVRGVPMAMAMAMPMA